MTKTRTLALRIAVSLTVTMFFLWLAFRGQDIHQLSHSLIEQPLLWFALLAALNIFSHLLRAIRWNRLRLSVDGYRCRVRIATRPRLWLWR